MEHNEKTKEKKRIIKINRDDLKNYTLLNYL